MNLELKAELVMAVEDYECKRRRRLDEWIDLTASDTKSDDKILLRVMNEPKSGVVGVDAVRKMADTMKRAHFDKGVLIGKRFSEAATEEMKRKNIRMVSERRFTPSFKPRRLYLRIQDYIDDLCKSTCGKVPESESDCKGYSDGGYSCRIRVISDNASFHYERGWTKLLQNDLMRLLTVHNSHEQQR